MEYRCFRSFSGDLKDDILSNNTTLLEPHPDGRIAVATLTKKRVMLSGEEE